MIDIKVCIGSSCFLKNSSAIVQYLKNRIEKENLSDEIILSGSFCAGKCNRVGVTIFVNNEIYTGITAESIAQFFDDKIKPLL